MQYNTVMGKTVNDKVDKGEVNRVQGVKIELANLNPEITQPHTSQKIIRK